MCSVVRLIYSMLGGQEDPKSVDQEFDFDFELVESFSASDD